MVCNKCARLRPEDYCNQCWKEEAFANPDEYPKSLLEAIVMDELDTAEKILGIDKL